MARRKFGMTHGHLVGANRGLRCDTAAQMRHSPFNRKTSIPTRYGKTSIPARCRKTSIPARYGKTSIPARCRKRCRKTSIPTRYGKTSIPARCCKASIPARCRKTCGLPAPSRLRRNPKLIQFSVQRLPIHPDLFRSLLNVPIILFQLMLQKEPFKILRCRSDL
jgi:hypothetical protein